MRGPSSSIKKSPSVRYQVRLQRSCLINCGRPSSEQSFYLQRPKAPTSHGWSLCKMCDGRQQSMMLFLKQTSRSPYPRRKTTTARRNRVSQACLSCRAWKIKCNRAQPACQRTCTSLSAYRVLAHSLRSPKMSLRPLQRFKRSIVLARLH